LSAIVGLNAALVELEWVIGLRGSAGDQEQQSVLTGLHVIRPDYGSIDESHADRSWDGV